MGHRRRLRNLSPVPDASIARNLTSSRSVMGVEALPVKAVTEPGA